MQLLTVKFALSVLLVAAACSLAIAAQDVSQYRVKLVGYDHNAPSFPGFGGTVGLMQDLKLAVCVSRRVLAPLDGDAL